MWRGRDQRRKNVKGKKDEETNDVMEIRVIIVHGNGMKGMEDPQPTPLHWNE